MKIDHVEVFVPSPKQAAEWYRDALGFHVVDEYRDWATEAGPLMISNDDGNTMVALFRGAAQDQREVHGFRRLAFRVNASEFLDFLSSSEAWRAKPLGREDIQDHGKAISVYFSDPFGNLLEVTTYEHAAVRDELPE